MPLISKQTEFQWLFGRKLTNHVTMWSNRHQLTSVPQPLHKNISLVICHILYYLPMQLIKHQINHPIAECGEGDHLNSEAGDTPAPSVERLSLNIEMNHHGSLTSLHDSGHRGSSVFELRHDGSASKDLLQYAREANHCKAPNPQLNCKTSVGTWKN
jgi:hypothetical protein